MIRRCQPQVEDERRVIPVFPDQGLHAGGDFDPDLRACLAAVVHDLAASDIFLSQVHDVHERHAEGHKTENRQVSGPLKVRSLP